MSFQEGLQYSLALGGNWQIEEDSNYLSQQLITYIGSKRTLLGPISKYVERVKQRLGKRRLRVFDAFSGSGVVSRFFKQHASRVVSNDCEEYAAVIGRCYLRNRSEVGFRVLSEIVDEMNRRAVTERFPQGFIEELYAPKDESNITQEDRVFYTRENAYRLDAYRKMVDEYPMKFKDLLLGPLLNQASVHANTAGIFKGFYKNRETGIGQYGGTGKDALQRIRGRITLETPVLSNFECEVKVLQKDVQKAAKKEKSLDIAYIDPPYNQHPYGSNYFMLNLLTKYIRPREISRVSGIPSDWRRSGYNVRSRSLPLLRQLLESIDAPFLMISFNNEGFIRPGEMREALHRLGAVEMQEINYNAFRGSRSFKNREVHVTEQLFLVERG